MVSEAVFNESWRLFVCSYQKSLTLVVKKSGQNGAEDAKAFAKHLVW